MKQSSGASRLEAFQSEPYPDEEKKAEPEKKKTADIIDFTQKAKEIKIKEIGRGYEKYALDGKLNPEEYQDVMKRAANKADVIIAARWSKYAYFMAQAAKITLSPETAILYGILREPLEELYSSLSDPQLLGEALLIAGDKDARGKLLEQYPNALK